MMSEDIGPLLSPSFASSSYCQIYVYFHCTALRERGPSPFEYTVFICSSYQHGKRTMSMNSYCEMQVEQLQYLAQYICMVLVDHQ